MMDEYSCDGPLLLITELPPSLLNDSKIESDSLLVHKQNWLFMGLPVLQGFVVVVVVNF